MHDLADDLARGPAAPLAPGTIEVWWSTIDLPPQLLDALRTDLDDETRRRIELLVRPDDRRRSLVAHALLRRRAAALLGVPPADVVVHRRCAACGATDHGRPELAPVAGAPAPPAVSLAHSGDVAVAALHAGSAVGVDVEAVDATADWSRIRGHLFADDEWASTGLDADPEAARLAAWTRKEAAAKATGHGIALGLERVRIAERAGPDGWRDAALPDGLAPLRVRDLALGDRCAAAVAAPAAGPAPRVLVHRLRA